MNIFNGRSKETLDTNKINFHINALDILQLPSFLNGNLKEAAQIMQDDVDFVTALLIETKMTKMHHSQSLETSRAEVSNFHDNCSNGEDYQIVDCSAANNDVRN